MKLRSGTVLSVPVFKLPEALDKKVETSLQNFKAVSGHNPKFAKEVLDVITHCRNRDGGSDLQRKFYQGEGYGDAEQTLALGHAASAIFALLFGIGDYYRENPVNSIEFQQYHDLMIPRVADLASELAVLGETEE